ncbi:hypothetical protein LSH36_53g02008 [Paralvinella palmiformis]|uniref:Uncharacterized protein n=1 Tax=Paralvinella palmiformis TaxID=53620 RepID=A0AAD9K5L0_9ANNE|nr:hypothetical protein LSH36_53g02008 [Paralvinella palmiformis]
MCRRQNANAQSPAEGRHRCNYQGVPSVECGTDDDRVNTSVCSQPSPTKSSLRDSGDAKKSSGTLSVSKRVCLQEPKDEDVHAIGNATSGSNDDVINDDDDDDQFDLKMRMKIGKCKRSSGRRHTVANIGTAEANFKGRRGSVDNQRGSANQLNYQYIRKWSVDIVALQEQLENPKLHPLPLEELVNFREKAQKSQPNETKASETGAETRKDESTATRGKEAELRMIKEQLSEEGDNVPSGNDPKSKTAADYRGTQAPNQNETKQRTTTKANENEVTISVCYAEDPSSSSVEVPAITIRANKCNELQDDVMIQTYDMPELTSNGDSQYDAKIKHKLTYTWRSIAHVLVVVVALVPLCIFLATFDDDISVRYVLMTVVLIQCPLQPLLIMWSDPIVEQAVRRLKLKMLSLRCVCYCNIGKGKRCLGRPPEYQ